MEKKTSKIPYPFTRRDDDVVDDYFGNKVPDPYRWLEDDTSEETGQWVSSQNQWTESYFSEQPFREPIRRRMQELFVYDRYSVPVKKQNQLYYFYNDGRQNQSILYRREFPDGEPEVLLDPNQLSEGGTAFISGFTFSHDNRHLAFTLHRHGSDWAVIQVMDTLTREILPEAVHRVKFSEASWYGDGFFYSAFPSPHSGREFTDDNAGQKVFYHALGTDPKDDRVVFEDPDFPHRYYQSLVSEDERYHFLVVAQGTSGNRILYRPLGHDAPFRVLMDGFEHDYGIVCCQQDRVYLHTNQGAGNFRLIGIDIGNHAASLTDIIPEQEQVLESVTYAGGCFFAHYLQDASSRVLVFDLTGKLKGEMMLPAVGTVSGFTGGKNDRQVFYAFESFHVPPSVFYYDTESNVSRPYFRVDPAFDPADYRIEQLFYPSTDEQSIPMFLVRKKDTPLEDNRPVHLTGYGGFNIPFTPVFQPAHIFFLEQGGIFVVANIRGGGEYGEKWHRAGMLDRKQQVFDDFIRAAEFLIEQGYTRPEKLAISGGSNGGLLVGACLTQRPELFAAAIPRVGVLDMLRFHKFTIGWGWTVEYGCSEASLEQFQWLYAYSPLHRLKNAEYPATLVMTADHDDRVVPAHSFKFAAALQRHQKSDWPVLIRIDSQAGHGAGKALDKIIGEQTDLYAFLLLHTQTHLR